MRRSLILTALLGGRSVAADELKIASWNIANLADPGKVLRNADRSPEDYEELRALVAELDADIIAFQEMGSIAALEAVLPDGYRYRFETRCYDNSTNCEAMPAYEEEHDIYTAIAIRDDLSGEFFQIDALAIMHEDECGNEPRPVRGAVGVDVTFAGQLYLIPSLHLKASCNNNASEVRPGQMDDCAVQLEQFEILTDWMDSQDPAATIILAGDFNRKFFGDDGEADNRRATFFPDLTDDAFLPAEEPRQCWAGHNFFNPAMEAKAKSRDKRFDDQGIRPVIYRPSSVRMIDFFVTQNLSPDLSIASDQIEFPLDIMEFRDLGGYAITQCDGESLSTFDDDPTAALSFGEAYPSDHCPIFMTLAN